MKHCLAIAFWASVLLKAQGVCVLDPVRTDATEGFVLFQFQGQHRVLNKGSVVLRDAHDEHQVASAGVESDGRFHLKGIKTGRYVLNISSLAMISVSADLQHLGARSKGSPTGILILLGADANKPCGGGSITILPMSRIKQILSNARPAASAPR